MVIFGDRICWVFWLRGWLEKEDGREKKGEICSRGLFQRTQGGKKCSEIYFQIEITGYS